MPNCKPEKSQLCGRACIPLAKTCRKTGNGVGAGATVGRVRGLPNCKPEKSQLCGRACIPLAKTCRKTGEVTVRSRRAKSSANNQQAEKVFNGIPIVDQDAFEKAAAADRRAMRYAAAGDGDDKPADARRVRALKESSDYLCKAFGLEFAPERTGFTNPVPDECTSEVNARGKAPCPMPVGFQCGGGCNHRRNYRLFPADESGEI